MLFNNINFGFARLVYRFRTLAFHAGKTGSIPVPSTIIKFIALTSPLGDYTK